MKRSHPRFRRVLSVLLSAVLMMGLLPATSFAKPAPTSPEISDSTLISTDALTEQSATLSAEDVKSVEATLTEGWTQCGTCEWQVDSSGKMTVRPLGGTGTGTLASWSELYFDVPWFSQRAILTSVVFEAGVSATTCENMFANFFDITSVDLSGLDISQAKTLSGMFKGCSSLVSITFPAGIDYTSADLHDIIWKDTTGATYATTSDMLSANAKRGTGTMTYTSLASEGWSPTGTCEWQISDGALIVRPLPGYTTGTLGMWDVADNVPWYNWRFGITSISFAKGVSAQTCYSMFYGARKLVLADLSGLDTSEVTNMKEMFKNCYTLKSVDLSVIDTSKAGETTDMFLYCPALTQITLPAKLDLTDASIHDIIWKDATGTTYATTPDMVGANAARTTDAMTYSSLATQGWNPTGTCEWQVDESGKLTVRPLTGNKTGTLEAWSEPEGVPWETQRNYIEEVVIEPGVVAQTCYCMFTCHAVLTSVDISGLDTSSVTNMQGMFSYCRVLETLDISGLDVSKVEDISSMFCWSKSLKTIYVPKTFSFDKVDKSTSMFTGCLALVGDRGSAYDEVYVDATRAHVDGGSENPGYFSRKHAADDGDVNANQILNVVDAQIAYDIATTDIYKMREDYAAMYTAADVDWDGTVDASDALAIQYAALHGWES